MPPWLEPSARYFTAVVVALSASTGFAGQGPAKLEEFDATERVVVASELFALVQQHFAHWETAPPSQIDASYRQFVTDAIESSTRAGFTRAALRFVASLRNGHTQFFDSQADGRPSGRDPDRLIVKESNLRSTSVN